MIESVLLNFLIRLVLGMALVGVLLFTFDVGINFWFVLVSVLVASYVFAGIYWLIRRKRNN